MLSAKEEKMFQFEVSLAKELQRQQNQDQFCDTILYAHGISVPVHSCVLSAFSTQLCGVLSTMPAPRAGQRRLIELQAVEALTLLRLVTLLYTGSLEDEAKDVLVAAQKLGINLPVQTQEVSGTDGGMETGREIERCEEMEAAEGECGSEERWSDRHPETKSMQVQEASVERLENETVWEKMRDTATQTDDWRQLRGQVQMDNDNSLSDPQDLINTFLSLDEEKQHTLYNTYRTSAHDNTSTTPRDGSVATDITLALNRVCDVFAGESNCAPTSQMCPTPFGFTDPASALLMPSLPPPVNSSEGVPGPAQSMVSGAGGSCASNTGEYEQFEENIPGFISYFLDPTHSSRAGPKRRGRKRTRAGATAGEGHNRARGRWRGGVAGGRRGRKRLGVARGGWSVGLVQRGQGGGMVGRKAGLSYRGGQLARKYQMSQGKDSSLEVMDERGGATPRCRSRARQRQRQRQRGRPYTEITPQLGERPPMKRRRGRPCAQPLPFPAMSRNVLRTSSPYHDITYPDPSLMHTLPLPPHTQSYAAQPIDWLLDDFMRGCPLTPPPAMNAQPNPHCGYVNPTTPSVHQGSASSLNPCRFHLPASANLNMLSPEEAGNIDVPPQSDGELSDILDHFLHGFDQLMEGCGLEEGEGSHLNQSLKHAAIKSIHCGQTTEEVQVSSVGQGQQRPGLTQSQPVQSDQLPPEPPSTCIPGRHCGRTVSAQSLTPPPDYLIMPQLPSTLLSGHGPQVPSRQRQQASCQKRTSQVKLERPLEHRREEEVESRRVTRSQTRKRKDEEHAQRKTQSGVERFGVDGPCRKKVKGSDDSREERSLSAIRDRKRGHMKMKCVQKHERCGTSVCGKGETECETKVCQSRVKDSTPREKHPQSAKKRAKTFTDDRCRVNGRAGRQIRSLGGEKEAKQDNQSSVEDRITNDEAYLETESSAFDKMRMLLRKNREREREREGKCRMESEVGVEGHKPTFGAKHMVGTDLVPGGMLEDSRKGEITGESKSREINEGVVREAQLSRKEGKRAVQKEKDVQQMSGAKDNRKWSKRWDREIQGNVEEDERAILGGDTGKMCEEEKRGDTQTSSRPQLPLLSQQLPQLYQQSSQPSPDLPLSSQPLPKNTIELLQRSQNISVSTEDLKPSTAFLKFRADSMTQSEKLNYFSHTLLHHELLPSHTPLDITQLSAGSEEEEVDVTELSGSESDTPNQLPVIWGVEYSPEEVKQEEEGEEEIDVIATA